MRTYFESLRIPAQPTFYDYLVLSLREKDVIATFNWDPLLLQAYRRNSPIRRLPQLAFLHGNVGLGICTNDKRKGHLGKVCGQCKNPFSLFDWIYGRRIIYNSRNLKSRLDFIIYTPRLPNLQ